LENEWLIGEGMALDPNEYFIIVPNMLGNSLSSSPSNTPPPTIKLVPPCHSPGQRLRTAKLVTGHFGIEKLALVTGWSMGAGQTCHWAMSYPEMIPQSAVLRLGKDRPAYHSVPGRSEGTLTADAAWNHGWYDEQPTKGLGAMARVYAGWGFSQVLQ